MLSTAADAAQLAQAAPWLAVGLLALAAAAWVYRQGRRDIRRVEDAAALSSRRQGERLGKLEHACGLLDLRRRQVEWVLLDLGVRLPYWPADGPDQPRPREHAPAVDEDLADDLADDEPATQQRPRVPVPPLEPSVAARHRRP